MGIWILRLSHRILRDHRVSTHCGLVARAFGADGIIYSGERDESILNSIKKTVEKWGGPFQVRYVRNWKKMIKEWKGCVVHLTMYGEPIQDKIDEIRNCKKDLLVVIGSEKVPSDVYGLATWNIAVTNQPHSEIAGLCLFLDRFFRGHELIKEFENARLKIIPQKRGKKIISL